LFLPVEPVPRGAQGHALPLHRPELVLEGEAVPSQRAPVVHVAELVGGGSATAPTAASAAATPPPSAAPPAPPTTTPPHSPRPLRRRCPRLPLLHPPRPARPGCADRTPTPPSPPRGRG